MPVLEWNCLHPTKSKPNTIHARHLHETPPSSLRVLFYFHQPCPAAEAPQSIPAKSSKPTTSPRPTPKNGKTRPHQDNPVERNHHGNRIGIQCCRIRDWIMMTVHHGRRHWRMRRIHLAFMDLCLGSSQPRIPSRSHEIVPPFVHLTSVRSSIPHLLLPPSATPVTLLTVVSSAKRALQSMPPPPLPHPTSSPPGPSPRPPSSAPSTQAAPPTLSPPDSRTYRRVFDRNQGR